MKTYVKYLLLMLFEVIIVTMSMLVSGQTPEYVGMAILYAFIISGILTWVQTRCS